MWVEPSSDTSCRGTSTPGLHISALHDIGGDNAVLRSYRVGVDSQLSRSYWGATDHVETSVPTPSLQRST